MHLKAFSFENLHLMNKTQFFQSQTFDCFSCAQKKTQNKTLVHFKQKVMNV